MGRDGYLGDRIITPQTPGRVRAAIVNSGREWPATLPECPWPDTGTCSHLSASAAGVAELAKPGPGLANLEEP
jgi:hypothetical protein